MSYKSLMAAAASTAILIATPALAQVKGGIGAGASVSGSVSQGPTNASPTGVLNASPNSVLNSTVATPPVSTTTTVAPTTSTTVTTPETGTTSVSTKSRATTNSQGLINASPNGISHASSNSVLARGAVQSSTLPGLTTGLKVNGSAGTQVGTVSRVITGPNHTIRAVVVKTTSGKTVTLPPSSISISGSVVTTTSTSIGG